MLIFCISLSSTNFFPPEIESQFYFMETLVPSCQGLDKRAPYLLSICALTGICFIVCVLMCILSVLALISCKLDRGEVGDSSLHGDSGIQVLEKRDTEDKHSFVINKVKQ